MCKRVLEMVFLGFEFRLHAVEDLLIDDRRVEAGNRHRLSLAAALV
jgi:hypothetical protein